MTSWPNYCNDAKVWLPMTQAAHDAGNVRTLDVSGNGLHYRFGDGSTAGTFPTKLSGQRGYQFDGSNDYLEALENQTNAITEGTWAVFFRQNSLGTYYCYGHSDASSNRGILLTLASDVRFYSGDSDIAIISIVPLLGQACFLAGTVNALGRRVYYNGLVSAYNNLGTKTPSTTVSGNPRLGINYGGGNPLPGRIYWYGHWETALTEIQLRDLESRLRKEFNNV